LPDVVYQNSMDAVAQIKQSLDIVDVVGGYVSLKKSGRNYKGVCPFHSEKTPSFMVNQELQIFKCFGCGQGGDIFTFVEQMEGLDFGRTLELLADKANIKLEKKDFDVHSQLKNKIYKINETAARFFNYLLTKHSLGKKGLLYLKDKRRLEDGTIETFLLGYAPDSWDTLLKFLIKKGFSAAEVMQAGLVVPRKGDGSGYYDKFRGRIIFPFFESDGKIVGFTGRTVIDQEPKYLNSPETPVFNKSNYLYGLDKARTAIKKQGAVFVEGQVDVISAHQAGIKNVIATTGTALTTGQLNLLARYTKDVTLCFDSDEAGISATKRAVDLAEKQGFNIKVVSIPAPYKDIDEMLGKDVLGVKRGLESGVPAYDFFLADALKRFDKSSGTGKKKIVEALAPIFGKISSPVLADHYQKKIAEELDISPENLEKAMRFDKKGYLTEETVSGSEPFVALENTPERYLITLLMASGIDTIGDFVYKLSSEDFVDPVARAVHIHIQKLFKPDSTKFNIEDVINSVEEEYKDPVLEMYVLSGDYAQSDKTLIAMLKSAYQRVKGISVKRKLKSLTEKIKLAELSGSEKDVKRLTEEFSELSRELII